MTVSTVSTRRPSGVAPGDLDGGRRDGAEAIGNVRACNCVTLWHLTGAGGQVQLLEHAAPARSPFPGPGAVPVVGAQTKVSSS
ncbi:MAG: hypothetical protein ACRDV8_04555 [Acidimicrobiales bacterium]